MDEKTGAAVDPISAAVIIADKTGCAQKQRGEVGKEPANFDIHDRVNYAAVSTNLMINADKKVIHLDIELDDFHLFRPDCFKKSFWTGCYAEGRREKLAPSLS